MKKYWKYITVALIVILLYGLLFFAYKKNSSSNIQTKSQIGELQKKMSDLEEANTKQSQKVQELEIELASTKNDQIKKLEEGVAKLEGKTATNNTKALESRLSTAEKNIGGLETSVEEAPVTSYLFNRMLQTKKERLAR